MNFIKTTKQIPSCMYMWLLKKNGNKINNLRYANKLVRAFGEQFHYFKLFVI